MQAFTIIGIIVTGLIAAALVWLLWEIAANIFWGIVGAYRLRAIFAKSGRQKASHLKTIGYGLRNWKGGQRLSADGMGTFIRWGMVRLPIDGRDKIQRDRFYGA